jgi:hypothetical protein
MVETFDPIIDPDIRPRSLPETTMSPIALRCALLWVPLLLHAQPAQQGGPWNHDVAVLRAAASGEIVQLATLPRAGVPTVTRLTIGRLFAAFQHFPATGGADFDQIAVCHSDDDGRSWSEPRTATFNGLPSGMMRPFDPTLVALPDGRVRLYFTGNYGRTFQQSVPAIYSAISADGLHFDVEPGVRFAVEGAAVIDCAVALHQGRYHLFAPIQHTANPPAGYYATSDDGLTFLRQTDVAVAGRRRWLGNVVSDGSRLVFFGTDDDAPLITGQSGRGGVWQAISSDGATWRETRTLAGITGADPGAVATRDGSWLLLVTTPPTRHDPAPHPTPTPR